MLEPKVLNVKPLEGYNLLLEFETGEKKIFDVNPYIIGSWFGKLRDPDIFNTVHPRGSTVEWADGQDIAPHELYELSEAVTDETPNAETLESFAEIENGGGIRFNGTTKEFFKKLLEE